MSLEMRLIKAFFTVRKKLGLATFGRKAKPAAKPPKALIKSTRYRSDWQFGFELHEIEPETRPDKVVIYLHGGGFVNAISSVHWQLIQTLSNESAARVLVPKYGLAPHHDVNQALEFVDRVLDYAKECELPIVLMGDSAGGNLALSSLLHLNHADAVSKLVLISPWLASDFSHPQTKQLMRHDPWLIPESLRRIAAIWSGEDNHQDPKVSPLRARIDYLPKTLMFMGQWDILLFDARDFYEKAQGAGVDIQYEELPKALHVYPLLPTPEGERARRQILDFLA